MMRVLETCLLEYIPTCKEKICYDKYGVCCVYGCYAVYQEGGLFVKTHLKAVYPSDPFLKSGVGSVP